MCEELKVGDLVVVTGSALRVVTGYDRHANVLIAVEGRQFREYDYNGWLRNVKQFAFLGWTYFAEGILHPKVEPSSNWTGDDEGEPAYLEETRRVKVAVVQPISVSRPAQYRKPFRCLPEQMTVRSAEND